MKTFLLAFFVFLSSAMLAQQTLPADNLLLGYQGFPTSITGHAADNQGNQYYTGVFRGQLTVNNQVLATGAGLEDIFWVKTNPSGQLLRYAAFGSANTEGSYTNAMAMGSGNRMLFGLNTFETLTLGSTSLIPYPSAGGSGFASGLVCIDTAGTVLWSKKTNLQNFKIYYTANVYHVFAPVLSVSPATKYGDVTVLDSLGKAAIVHLMIDDNGNFLGVKYLSVRKPSGQGLTLYNVSSFSDKTLFLNLRVDADSSFQVNNTKLSLPNTLGSYHVFLRIDTSYLAIKSKILNPQRHTLAGLGNQFMPACVGPNDSVYTVFTVENNTVPFSLDGFSSAPLLNNLYAMDASLTVRRQVMLGNSLAGTYPLSSYRRRLFFRQMLFQNGKLFLNGFFTGVNESPINAIPSKDTAVVLLPGLKITVNQNGPSKGFLAKCDVVGANGAVNWYGEHTEYENINLSPTFFHAAGPGRIAFAQTADNVWNPWIADENLTVLTGAMRKGVDQPEIPQMVQYFVDGSRVVIGYARGKTALDTSSTFITNAGRKDVFVVRLRANNQVVWYKRFFSTLTSADIRGLEIRNGKAYFLINYLGSQNDSNYIKVENSLYNVRANASLLSAVDTTGNLTVLNLTNPLLRPSMLLHFAFFSNDDLAVVTDINPVSYASFPPAYGQQILRLNSSSGFIVDGRKFGGGAGLNVTTIRVDKKDQLHLSGGTLFTDSNRVYLYDATGRIVDSLLVAANTQSQPAVLKMDWNKFQWLKRVSGSFFIRQFGDLVMAQDKPVVCIFSPANTQPAFWDGQLVHSGFSTSSISLVKLNGDGSIASKKTIAKVSPNYMRGKEDGTLYITGITGSSLQADTIQVGYAGGIIDGLALVFDSNLVAKRSFRVGSPYSETMLDMDIYQDSVAALAYTGQTVPQVYLNRTSVATSDYLEDAYVGTLVLKKNVVTGINTPMPPQNSVSIMPNPVVDKTLRLKIAATEPLRSLCTVYQSNGQYVSTEVLQLTPGTYNYNLALPGNAAKGVYTIVISNKRWTTTRVFVVL